MPRTLGSGPAAGVPAPVRPEPAWSVPLPVGPAIWASLAAVSLVVMAELNRLAADILDAEGASWSFSDVFGVSRALSPWNGAAAWGAWEALGRTTSHVLGSRADVLVRLLDLHVLADVLFVLAYTGLAGSLLRSSPWLVTLVRALAAVDLLEDAAAFALGLRIRGGHATAGLPEHLIGVVTTVKWLLALSALIGAVLVGTGRAEAIRRQLVDPQGVLRPRPVVAGGPTGDAAPPAPAAVRSGTGPAGTGPAGTGPAGTGSGGTGPGGAGPGAAPAPLRLALAAVWLQRFSLIALVPLAVLAAGPGGETLDQFPDVARSWTDGPAGLRYLGWACAGLVLLVATLLTLGRLRSDRVWRERACAVRRLAGPAPGLWVAVPVLVGLLGLVTRLTGLPVSWTPLVVIALLSGLVLAASWFAGRTARGRRLPVYGPDLRLARATLVTGDVLALSAVVVAGLGLVRAYAAPAAVGGAPADWLLVLLGTASALAVWPVGERLRRLLARRPGHLAPRLVRGLWEVLTPGKGLDVPTAAGRGMTGLVRFRQGVRLGLAAAAVGLLFAVGATPVWSAHTFGVLACAQSAITGLVLLVGVIVVVSRDHLPLPLFRWLGLRSTPVVALMAVSALVVSYQTSDPGLHGVQGIGRTGVTAPDARPTLADAFSGWLSRSSPCDVTVAAGPGAPPVTVRPVLFVAADGGGIRAAYWTASAMSAIARDGGACGPHVTLLSSGVSGGSLGLMLSQTAADPMRAVRRLADQDALAAAGLGLLVRDNLATLTGSQLPSWLSGGLSAYPSNRWQDRAALMEGIWQQQAPQLGDRFLAERPGAVTGPLVLNSTSVGTGCRVLVSQLRFPASRQSAGGTGPIDPACRSGAAPLPATFDLLADYAAAPGRSGAGCLGDLSAASAVMLSARFAYVTPSGVAGPCGP
ncbi:MAG TPA: hypothetical protein VFP72_20715, partial [Kineosporiaceae bacterium]|nr:hypothetical protein [Kineosporiaceae bacterium]